MNRIKILLAISISTLLLLGCGGSSSNKKDRDVSDIKSTDINNTDTNSVDSKPSISIPKEINIDIPKALKDSSKRAEKGSRRVRKQHKAELGESRGYLQLKDEISQLEDMKSDLEINLLFAGQLIGDIEKSCQDISLGTTCTIEANKLSLLFTQDIIDEMSKIMGEIGSSMLGETIPLGEVKFTQYSGSETFQYALAMDMSDIEEGEDAGSSTQTIKWSKDETHVFSSYSYRDDTFENEMTMDYTKKADGQREMRTDDTYFDKETQDRGSFHFKIVQLPDEEEHFKVESSSKDSMVFDSDRFDSSFSSKGEISPQGGFLTFVGLFEGDDEFKEKELFDGEGNIISSSYCDTLSDCKLDDESTWLEYGEVDFELDDEFDIDESFEELEDFEFTPLSVTGGNLQEGEYLLLSPTLLPSDIDIEQMSLEMILNASVGDIFSFEGEVMASLHSSSYKDQLNSLILVREILSEEEEFVEPSFKIVADIDRPTLSITPFEDIGKIDEPIEEIIDYFPTFQISVTGGNLQDGEYLLYDPLALQDINISEIDEPSISDWAEDGYIEVSEATIVDAYLLRSLTQEQVDALVLIKRTIELVDGGTESERLQYSYVEIKDSDRPTITLMEI